MKIVKLVCALLLSACISVSHANVIHVTDASGNLLGAENVLVDGTLYDVAFSDGTCIALYKGCDEPSDFIFSTRSLADLASRALLDTVFIDIVSGKFFDTQHTLTNGCSTGIFCYVMTPYNMLADDGTFVSVAGSWIINYNAQFNQHDQIQTPNYQHIIVDVSDVTNKTYAVWTKAVDVPEPGTVILLSLGLAGLSFSRYRKQS